jgi:hypothetical protein
LEEARNINAKFSIYAKNREGVATVDLDRIIEARDMMRGPVIIVNGGLGSKELIKDKSFGVKDWEEALDSINEIFEEENEFELIYGRLLRV